MATKPATIPSVPYGIVGTNRKVDGFIVQEDDHNNEPITDELKDELGQVVAQTKVDDHETITVSMIGDGTAPIPGKQFTYDSKVYWIKSVRRVGSYNGRQKYTVVGEKWANFSGSAT